MYNEQGEERERWRGSGAKSDQREEQKQEIWTRRRKLGMHKIVCACTSLCLFLIFKALGQCSVGFIGDKLSVLR